MRKFSIWGGGGGSFGVCVCVCMVMGEGVWWRRCGGRMSSYGEVWRRWEVYVLYDKFGGCVGERVL